MADIQMGGRGFAPQAGSIHAYQAVQSPQAPQHHAPQGQGAAQAVAFECLEQGLAQIGEVVQADEAIQGADNDVSHVGIL